MTENDWLANGFERNRGHLRAVAYRMLGSLSEAEDAVQEAWLRFNRSDTSGVENLGGWLTTVVARVCLDMLRSRRSRREDSLGAEASEPTVTRAQGIDPEQEAVLADSVGIALLVVIETLTPAERLAFVLHDMFAVSFDEIAPIVGRSEAAARQLASRARRRVHGATVPNADVTCQRRVVEAFLAAARRGDFEALLTVLDPDVVHRTHAAGVPSRVVRGASVVAQSALAGARRAAAPTALALVNGDVGVLVARQGRLFGVVTFKVTGERIVEMDVIVDPARLRQLNLALLEN